MKRILDAARWLTIARRYRTLDMNSAALGSAMFYFPLIGLALSLVLAGLNNLLEPYLESEVLGTVDVTILILMTGAVHLEEMQRKFDLLSTGPASEGRLNSPVGIYGLLAVILVVLFKVRAIEVVGETRSLTLLLAPALARWTPILFVYGGRPAAGDSADIGRQVKSWHLIATTVLVLALAGYFMGVAGLWVALCLSLLALLGRVYVNHRRGGFSRDDFGPLVEIGECLSFVLFASL